MKIYHSYWSKGYQGSPSNYLIDLHNLSAYLAKKQYGEIHLITDTEGKKHLKDIGYASISTTLDELPENYGPVWSLGKLKAYNQIANKGDPFMHIDFDVLLWKQFSESFLTSPVFAERLETNVDWRYNVTNFNIECPEKHDLKTLVKDGAINAGIFGGNNLNLIFNATKRSIDFVLDPKNKEFMTSTEVKINVPNWSRATIAEQLYLYQYCLMNNQEINFLIKTSVFENQEKECVELGYTHLWGLKNQLEIKQKIHKRMEEFNLKSKEQYVPTLSWAISGTVKAVKAMTYKSTEQSEKRLAICRSCPKWTGTSCKVCGCFVNLKVKIPEEKCPEGKW